MRLMHAQCREQAEAVKHSFTALRIADALICAYRAIEAANDRGVIA